MENIERFGYPLIVVAAVASIWYALRRRDTFNPASPVALDHTDASGGFGLPPQYLADPATLALSPEYIAATTADPYNPGNGVGSSPYANSTGDLSANTQGTASLRPLLQLYQTGSMDGISNGYVSPGSKCGGCSGGCGCKPKCKTDCATNVRFTDGRGTCMAQEPLLSSPISGPMQYYGVDNGLPAPLPA